MTVQFNSIFKLWLGLHLLVAYAPCWGMEPSEKCSVTVASFDKYVMSRDTLSSEILAAAKIHEMEFLTIRLYKSKEVKALEEQLKSNDAMKHLIRDSFIGINKSTRAQLEKTARHDPTDVVVEKKGILFMSTRASEIIRDLTGPTEAYAKETDKSHSIANTKLCVGFADLRKLLGCLQNDAIEKTLQSKDHPLYEEAYRSMKSLREETELFSDSRFRDAHEIDSRRIRISRINEAAKCVARRTNLELVVDISQVWLGADFLRQKGCDVTAIMIDELKHASDNRALGLTRFSIRSQPKTRSE